MDDNLTWRDLTVESGFINAYTSDKNRPHLEDKVFLVYDSEVNTIESQERYSKFEHLDSLYNKRYITINKHHYTVYCLCNPKYNKDINRLKAFGKLDNIATAKEIVMFWNNVPVPELTQRLYYPTYRMGESITAELPEEDYYPYENIKGLVN